MADAVKEEVPKCSRFESKTDPAGCGEPTGVKARARNSLDPSTETLKPAAFKKTRQPVTKPAPAEQDESPQLMLPRNCVPCPITNCNSYISGTMALAHFISYHCGVLKTQVVPLLSNQCTPLTLEPEKLAFRKNVCLGVLVYGGVTADKGSLPVERGICLRNNSLPREHNKYHSHMPIVVMACKTNYDIFCKKPEPEAPGEPAKSAPVKPGTTNKPGTAKTANAKTTTANTAKPAAKPATPQSSGSTKPETRKRGTDILCLWLMTVPSTKIIHCTVTCFDRSLNFSKSKIMQFRPLNKKQDIDAVLEEDGADHLILHDADIKQLSANFTTRIEVEVTVQEYPDD